ncbi:MAG: hypothetical protein PHQ66_03260 [Candidatus Nanoarchaeia archaeon]|nr:hypothetical protein [Candidatus Nanoarchaeia archaeon]MDD5357618.1 hypothetical protein [Candidatus Nanoarchaeia archaeon]MDD5588537.1 hypothetical protein [Candidatus Nanoarchaeia archaeon]
MREEYNWSNETETFPIKEERWSLGLIQENKNWKGVEGSSNFQVYLDLRNFPERDVYNLKNYRGKIDTTLEIIFPDGFDSDPAGTIYLNRGEMKVTSLRCDYGCKNIGEVITSLDKYPGTENLGTSLKSIIRNSNLPPKQKDSVKSLTE